VATSTTETSPAMKLVFRRGSGAWPKTMRAPSGDQWKEVTWNCPSVRRSFSGISEAPKSKGHRRRWAYLKAVSSMMTSRFSFLASFSSSVSGSVMV
jgi:hypothetical protein